MNLFQSFLSRLGKWFAQGLLLVAPLGLTIAVIWWLVTGLNAFIVDIIPLEIPGLSLLIVVAGIVLIGFLGNFLIRLPLFNSVEKLFSRAPLVKLLYSSIKDLTNAFVSNEKRKFNSPVLVKLDVHSNLERIGFVTASDLEVLGFKDKRVGVYFPYSYGIMGVFYIVPESQVTALDISASEAMKLVVSGGIAKH